MFKLKPINAANNIKTRSNKLLPIIEETLKLLPESLLFFLEKNKLKFLFTDKQQHATSELDEFNIILSKKATPLKCKENLLHELGHFAFLYLIFSGYIKQNINILLQEFTQAPALSPHADKYMKGIFGKQLKEAGKDILYGYEIKYHENFAEGFRLYYSGQKHPIIEKLIDEI